MRALCRGSSGLIFCVYALQICNSLPYFLNGRLKGGSVGAPGGSHLLKLSELPPAKWFQQPLDHFNPSDLRSWDQRYYVNDTFYKPGGPVFLMIGGEGTASPKWMVQGQWIEFAQQYNAFCFQLEHRYYGESHPTKDMSTDNLAFLSSEQALADLANFRVNMSITLGLVENKWIAFGGSYPGSLAAWFRLKYPHLVHASVASSAPIFAKLNFYEYLEVVTEALDRDVPHCTENIRNATDQLLQMVGDIKGRQVIKDKFRLCDDIDQKNEDDIANLFNTLAGNFENVVQYNKDNRDFVGANITIDTLCGIMTDVSKGSPVDRYALVNSLLLDTYSQKCLDFKYDKMISDLQQTNWNSSASEGGRQWMYQTCTEFGYYQSSDYDKQPFGRNFPIRFSVKQCKDIYGDKFTEDYLNAALQRTNTMYGGYGLKVSRVVFPSGSTDPWHALGITSDLCKTCPAIFIHDIVVHGGLSNLVNVGYTTRPCVLFMLCIDTAHCADMYPDSPHDPPQLKQARDNIRKLIGQWLSED